MKYRGIKVIFVGSLLVLLIIILTVFADRRLKNKGPGRETGNATDGKSTAAVTDNMTSADSTPTGIVPDAFLTGPDVMVDYLTVNEFSRPGTKLKKVNAIVIHYVGNPGTTAAQNRNYFEGLKDGHAESVSSHYVVGLQGEIIQCVPLDEVSYASNNRNRDTIAIECCHPDATGRFNTETYDSLVRLAAALCNTYGLSPDDGIIRHYDITGKRCPLYYVENEDEWYGFKLAVKSAM